MTKTTSSSLFHHQELLESIEKILSGSHNKKNFHQFFYSLPRSTQIRKELIPRIEECAVHILDTKFPLNFHEKRVILSLFFQNPSISVTLARFALLKLEERIEAIRKGEMHSFFSNALIKRCLATFLLPDRTLEIALTYLREALLFSLKKQEASPLLLDFLGHFVLFHNQNEYLFYRSPAEKKCVAALKNSLCTETQALLLGLYEPPWNFQKYLQGPLLREEYEAVKERRALAQKVPSLIKNHDLVSATVQARYEEYPYPRWSTHEIAPLAVQAPTLAQYLCSCFSLPLCEQLEQPVKTLIAGCGTGKQIFLLRNQIAIGECLAIDLSKTSLSYAWQKALELLPQERISFLHANLLDLDLVPESFDFVSCTGVLHHLEEPRHGWEAIVSLTKPGGALALALYSATARKAITKFRQEQKEPWTFSDDAIRALRWDILLQKEHRLRWALGSSDFYTLSKVRDLLFHPQEMCYTLPLLKEMLEEFSLQFLGWNHPKYRELILHFQRDYPSSSLKDLDTWHDFELRHPQTFAGMYQFWVLKQ